MIRIASRGEVEFIFQADQVTHGIRGRRVHANAAIPIEGHEAEGLIDLLIHNRQIQAVLFSERRPVMNARAAQRVDAEPDATDCIEVNHVWKIANVFGDKIVAMRG